MSTSRNLRLDLARYYRLPSVQVSLGVVLAFLMSAFFIMFAIRPTFATIVSLQKEIEESRKLVTTLETKVSALNAASSLLDKIKPNLPSIEKSIPSDGIGYETLSRNLEALSQNTGVNLDSFTLGPSVVSSRLVAIYTPDKKEEVIEAPITIRINGSYAALNEFLSRLMGTIRLTSLESVALFRDGARGSSTAVDTTSLTLTITGSVHYLAEPGALAKVFPEENGGK